MEGPAADRDIREWDESDVHAWLSVLGYPQYENQIREHKIRGDALCLMNADDLKSLGISSIGQRLSILKAIYQVKVAHSVPIEEDHYIPPSELAEMTETVTIHKLHTLVKEQGQRLRTLEEENRSLNTILQTFIDEFNGVRSSLNGQDEGPSIRRQHSFKWANFDKPQKSPTRPEALESPHASPRRAEHDMSRLPGPPARVTPPAVEKPRPPHLNLQESNDQPAAPKASRQESSDNLKGFKVTLEDPTWKVLPAALKKYRINNDTWQNYAMFICYGSPGNRIERCLSYDEKPLLLFQKLKDAKKNPVFMLKHIKDIRSPIAVAQQKHAARKASSVISTDTSVTTATHGHQKAPSQSRTNHKPPRLEVPDHSAPAMTPGLPSTTLSPQPGWPDNGMVSPGIDNSRDESTLTPASASTLVAQMSNASSSTLAPSNSGNTDAGKQRVGSDEPATPITREALPNPNGISYAVAIYPYMAEQDDEFDVVVGDTFIILSRAKGWWVVQRDPSGSGIVDTDIVKQGWVPAGCLLETRVPVASAIAEAAAKGGSGSKTPILPLSIISTSFPGIALMDYKKKGEEELDLNKDDLLRVFKRYNHWSYAVKEDGGDRGWVPSWFIGKVTPSGPVPSTPNTGMSSLGSTSMDEIGQNQVSPMSSAFPPVQSQSRS
ncbi:protein kinase regulator [Coprinopsis cinerea okayama7|uniref:Protein kinase regulator n=2 Tax=Coprinopsis cinerea TaxID=5346 RepID=A8N9A0_COPC7|nr:protein kinase regulator [Coprinopsis cinerea okayama7\|eukprot:XP_001831428.1 protein kinase regulator [Coprinopsis cinerea okayama7\